MIQRSVRGKSTRLAAFEKSARLNSSRSASVACIQTGNCQGFRSIPWRDTEFANLNGGLRGGRVKCTCKLE